MDVRRIFWTLFGAVNQLLFGVTVIRLYFFLGYGDSFHSPWTAVPRSEGWVVIDSALAVQFAFLHSVMLYPPVRSRLNTLMPPELGGSFFCAVSCISLIVTMEGWTRSPWCLWTLHGMAGTVLFGLFLASWGALTYSLWLTGFGHQTGFTPWWAWVLHRNLPRRRFEPRGAYRVIRHPVYLSFLGLVWFNPTMSLDRLTLAVLWTVHVFVGSYLKDRRLERYIGEPYRQYESRVPGYPLLPGPLGKRPAVEPATSGHP